MNSESQANSALHKKALRLSYFTLGYNLLEGLVSVFAGILAQSTALVGFGLDSFVESLSGGVMVWRFGKKWASKEEEMKSEKKAVHLVAAAFFILGAYVLFESAQKLYERRGAEPSLLGIAIAIVSLIVMPVLFLLKYRTGKKLESKSLVADSKQTLACMFLSAALLAGLWLNYSFQIWWADPAAGLLIAGYLLYEGYETWREGRLCAC
ncbi:MAG TPA: cation transporter [Verrucomicrobiae bacterium]|nr:cation transporter [Verrucomicrobiae bacterium]